MNSFQVTSKGYESETVKSKSYFAEPPLGLAYIAAYLLYFIKAIKTRRETTRFPIDKVIEFFLKDYIISFFDKKYFKYLTNPLFKILRRLLI